MERVAIDDLDPTVFGSDADRHGLTEPLGTTDVAINRYRLGPGEGFPGGLHAHLDQEEVFVVLEGEATFETLVVERDDGRVVETGEVSVGAGEAIRFAPGEFQSGRNGADRDLVALAIGAPRNTEDVRVPLACPDCGHADLRIAGDASGPKLACPDCPAEYVPQGCPECGGELHAALGEAGRPVVVCPACGLERETPPFAE